MREETCALATGIADQSARVRNPERADALVDALRDVTGVRGLPEVKVDWDRLGEGGVIHLIPDWTDTLTDGFEERMKVEPIGEYCVGKKVVVAVESLKPIRGEVRWRGRGYPLEQLRSNRI